MKVYLSTIDPNAHMTARKYGLGLEIAEYCTAWNMDEKFLETHAKVREEMAGARDIVLHGPFNELFPCAIDPMVREIARHRYRQAIKLAQKYDAPKIIIHGGYNPRLYYPVWYTEESVRFWKEFLTEVPDEKMIVLENVLEEEPGMILDIIRQVNNPKLRMCLDIGHVNAYSSVPLSQWLEVCGPYIRHFHIHNNDGSLDTHNALMEGSIPMAEFLRESVRKCPDATFTLEVMDAESSVRWLKEEVWNRFV